VNNSNTANPSIKYSIILLKQLVKTDFKLRYQGSALGYLWSLLKPLFLFGILYIVFVKIVGVDYGVDNDGVYLLFGIVLWSLFSEMTGGSVTSVVGKGDLLRKINFPKYVIVLATGFSTLINLTLNMIIVAVFMVISGVDVGLTILWAPLIFLELIILSLGIGFFLSAAYVKLRDVGYIWDVLLQAGFYLTPILFPLSFAPIWGQKILMLNPVAQIIQDLRYVMVSDKTITIADVFGGNHFIRIIPVTITLLLLGLCTKYFFSRSKNFAEDI
jgi:ABC-2 type transport system permease protein